MSQAPILHIGTVAEAQSAEIITNSIVKIMESRADQETIRTGLLTFAKAIKVENIVIQNCNITGDKTTEISISSNGGVTTKTVDNDSTGLRVE